MADCELIADFANLKVSFLLTELMKTCFEQGLQLLIDTHFLLNIKHALLSVVLRNDEGTTVLDSAKNSDSFFQV